MLRSSLKVMMTTERERGMGGKYLYLDTASCFDSLQKVDFGFSFAINASTIASLFISFPLSYFLSLLSMFTTQQPQVRQEYGTAKGWRLFIYVFIPPLILLFLAFPFLMWDKRPELGPVIGFGVVGLGAAVLSACALIEIIKAKHIITDDMLIYEGAFRRKELPLANIKGYRIDQNYTHIFPKTSGDPKIRIGYSSENYETMQRWFANRYPDLDALEQEQEVAKLLQDEELGRTPSEREEVLSKAQKAAQILNIAGGITALWLFLHPQPYQWAIIAGLVVPALATIVLWLHNGVLRLDERKNSAYPSIAIAVIGPALSLLLRVLLDFDILDYAPLWPQAATVAFSAIIALFIGSRDFIFRNDSRVSLLLTILTSATLYGFAGTLSYNCAFDEGTATIHEVKVLDKSMSGGKTTTYHLKVTPWGPRPNDENVTVTQEYYEQVKPGDKVEIYAMPGQLGIPWFTVVE